MADQFSDDELLRLYKNPKSDLSLLSRDELQRIDKLTVGPVPASEQPELPEGPTTSGYLDNVASGVGEMVAGIPTLAGAVGGTVNELVSGRLGRDWGAKIANDPRGVLSSALGVGGEIVKPYTSIDNLLASLYHEPLRAPMDASVLLGGAGAAAGAAKYPTIARTLARAGEAINPVQLVTRPVAATARAIPRGQIRAGRSLIKRAIKPGMAAVKDTTAYKKGLGLAAGEEDMINAFINHDLSTNVKGVDKGMAAIRSNASQVTADAAAASGSVGKTYKVGTSKPAENAVAKMAADSPFGQQYTPNEARSAISKEVKRVRKQRSKAQTVTRQVPGPSLGLRDQFDRLIPGPTVSKTVKTGKVIRDPLSPAELLEISRAENELVGKIVELSENPNIGREFAATKGKSARDALHRMAPSTVVADKNISELIPIVDALQNMVFSASRRTPVPLYDMLTLAGVIRGSPTAIAPFVAGASSRGALTGAAGKSLAKAGGRNANRLSALPGETSVRGATLLGETAQRLIEKRKNEAKAQEAAKALAELRSLLKTGGSVR